jgi:uncharacterized protein (DUF2461 family)
VILKITYGYTTEAHRRDPLVDLAQDTMHIFADATTPGKWLVDVMPFCEFITISLDMAFAKDRQYATFQTGLRVQGSRL